MAVSSAAEKREGRLSDHEGSGRERLGGARADFVANLGRRRVEIKSTLEVLRDSPDSRRHVGELRRRFHALGAAAKLLRFARLAEEVRAVEDRLDVAAERGRLGDADFGAVLDLLGRMTALAWGGEEATAVKPFANEAKRLDAGREPARPPVSALVVGAAPTADALALPTGRTSECDGLSFDVERAADVRVAVDLARALAPDVVVVDGDLPQAADVVADLQNDTLTEATPVVVCLRVTRTEDAAPFIALGVAKVLPKPVSPGELRRACAAVVDAYVRREVIREPLGDVNVRELGDRLAEELRRGLCDMVDPKSRDASVKLGEGTEIFAALWGAVARIRDVVTIQSQGKLRFSLGGPEGAVPLAAWLDTDPGGPKRAVAQPVARQGEGTLDKTRILVVDDDAAVCWFLAGVLKSAGATVYEARDGERALEIAKHAMVDLVITDVLMPKLDGFSLCRMLKRDVLLRDVPVVLLSWKEDLLQRVRELGADADGYLKKEASATAVVQRARELVRGKQRIAHRIAGQGEVRGRLDGITTFSLLRSACEARRECTVTVRDATFLYEVEIRRGVPVRATRTSLSGSFERGAAVLGALLGVGDGRFVVSQPREDQDVGPVREELAGQLIEQITPVVAHARAAQRLLGGVTMLHVSRLEIDEDAVRAYWAATPEPARNIVAALANGASPRTLVSTGQASARLLEDVLMDLAVHGGVVQVFDGGGEDRLPEATSAELALLTGQRAAQPVAAITLPTMQPETPAPAPPIDVAMPAPDAIVKEALGASKGLAAAPELPELSVRPPLVGMPVDPFAPVPSSAAPANPAGDDLDDPWFDAPPTEASADESPSPASGPRALTPMPAILGTLTPVGLETNASELRPAPGASKTPTPTPSSVPPPPGLKPMLSLGSLHPPPVQPETPAPPKNRKTSPKPGAVSERSKKESTPKPSETTPRFPLPSAYLPRAAEAPRRDRKVLYWVAFALVGVVFAVWARWSRDQATADESVMMSSVERPPREVAETEQAPQSEPLDDSEPAQTRVEAAKPIGDDALPEELPIRDTDKLKKGQGLLEVVAGKSDTIYIDGKPVGSGPTVNLPLKARKYEVRVKTRGDERTRFVEVKEGKLVRIRIAPPWQR